jgi:hypothetical protein
MRTFFLDFSQTYSVKRVYIPLRLNLQYIFIHEKTNLDDNGK